MKRSLDVMFLISTFLFAVNSLLFAMAYDPAYFEDFWDMIYNYPIAEALGGFGGLISFAIGIFMSILYILYRNINKAFSYKTYKLLIPYAYGILTVLYILFNFDPM